MRYQLRPVGFVAILLLLSASLMSGRGQVPVPRPTPDGRIQLNEWRDRTLGVSDPLFQIVRITRDGYSGSGTGFLLANCRIMTAAHVLALGFSESTLTIATLTESDLIGERFNYETQPLPALGGRRARSQFVVLGHGVTASHARNVASRSGAFAREDWAVGYDESCMAEKYQLGHFEIFWSATLKPIFGPNATGVARSIDGRAIEGRRLFTAGYSYVQVPGVPPDTWPMYIDSNCQLKPFYNSGDERSEFARFRHVVTDCQLYPGGSGQPLLSAVMEDGRVARDGRGRPRIEALGLFQSGINTGTESEVHLMVFSSGAFRDLRRFLTVEVTGRLRVLLSKESAERDADRLVRIALRRRLAKRDWSAQPTVDAGHRCVTEKGRTGIDICTASLQSPNLTKLDAFSLLQRRGELRTVEGVTGPALRDMDLALAIAETEPAGTFDDAVLGGLYGVRGMIYHDANLFEESKKAYDKAVELALRDPPSGSPVDLPVKLDILRSRADVHDHLRQYAREAEDYRLVIALAPNDSDAYNGRCFALASLPSHQANQNLALAACNKALELKPRTPTYLDSRALTYLKMNRPEDALRDYDAALMRNAEMPGSLFGRGITKLRLGIESGRADILAATLLQEDIGAEMAPRGLELAERTRTPRVNSVGRPQAAAAFPTLREVLEKEVYRDLNAIHTLLGGESVQTASEITTVELRDYTPSDVRIEIRRAPLTPPRGRTMVETTTLVVKLALLSDVMEVGGHAISAPADLILACRDAAPTSGGGCIEVEDAAGRRRAVSYRLPLPGKNAGVIAILLKSAVTGALAAQ